MKISKSMVSSCMYIVLGLDTQQIHERKKEEECKGKQGSLVTVIWFLLIVFPPLLSLSLRTTKDNLRLLFLFFLMWWNFGTYCVHAYD